MKELLHQSSQYVSIVNTGFTIMKESTLPVLRAYYEEKARPFLKNLLGLDNDMAVPRISKVVLNSCSSAVVKDSSKLQNITSALEAITGRHPKINKATQHIASFGVRQGQPLGAMVTLRGNAQYDFLFNLIYVDLPGSKIQELPTKCDGHGNYSMGIREHIMFKAIRDFQEIFGLNITITVESGLPKNKRSEIIDTSTKDMGTICLLRSIGMPIHIKSLEEICPIGGLHTL